MRFFSKLSFGAKVASSLAVVGVATAAAGLGTFASFTSSASAPAVGVTSGTVVIGLGSGGTANLTVGASDLAPGDTMQRAFDISNTGTLDLAAVTLTTTAPTSTILDTDTTNGLHMVLQRCSVAWTEVGAGPYTYTCSGTTDSILASRAVIGSALDLSAVNALNALAPAGVDHLKLTLTLPATADDTFQGLSSTISYDFAATQRAATNK